MDTESVPDLLTLAVHPTTGEQDLVEREEDDYSFDSSTAGVTPHNNNSKKILRPQNLASIPELLAMRQVYGSSSLALPPAARPRRITTDVLSSKIAW
jgi:hypothetical protein